MSRGLNNRFIRLMRDGNQGGGPPVAGGGGPANQGQAGGQATQGDPGGQGQGQAQNLDGLFDDVDDGGDAGDGNQAGGGQGAGQSQGQQQQGGFNQAQLDQIASVFDRGFDRRITQMNRRRGRQQQASATQTQGAQADLQPTQPPAPQQPVVDDGARREARIAFRDYIGDEMQRFVSATERQAAMAFGQNLVTAWDGDGDADEFGRESARQVAQTIRGLRDHYRDLTVRQLRKRGLLIDPGQQGSAPSTLTITAPGAGSTPPAQLPAPTQAAKAVQAAVGLAGEFNVRNGHVPQTAGVTGA